MLQHMPCRTCQALLSLRELHVLAGIGSRITGVPAAPCPQASPLMAQSIWIALCCGAALAGALYMAAPAVIRGALLRHRRCCA